MEALYQETNTLLQTIYKGLADLERSPNEDAANPIRDALKEQLVKVFVYSVERLWHLKLKHLYCIIL